MAEAYRPKLRQSGNRRGEQPVFRIDKATVIGENKIKSNRPIKPQQEECDCACSLV